MIVPCCAMGDTDYGDYILDYLEPKKWRGEGAINILNNSAIVALKRGLLTGDLHPMCRNCALQQMISVEEFKTRLEKCFEEWNISYEKESDYAEVNAIQQLGIGVTNRCNLRCIYCNQSVLADINPYFKVDFPEEVLAECLEDFAYQGIKTVQTGAFGEATLSPGWYKTFSEFHKRHPEVRLMLVTNLCKKYSEEEIELLAEHDELCVSMETLDPELFGKLRVNGRLDLLLENLGRINAVIDKKNYNRSRITITSVICNLTWRDIPEVSRFAFENGYAYVASNLEKRDNSVGVRDGLLQSVEELCEEERDQVKHMLLDAQKYAEKHGLVIEIGVLTERAGTDYNMFEVYDDNPVYRAFAMKYPTGTREMFLAVEYDHLGNQHLGIKIKCGTELEIACPKQFNTFVIREVHIYKDGTCASKYSQKVFLDYKKKVHWESKVKYFSQVRDKNVEWVLLQVLNWWKED